MQGRQAQPDHVEPVEEVFAKRTLPNPFFQVLVRGCLLYTSDAADERSSVDLGGRRIIKKKKNMNRG